MRAEPPNSTARVDPRVCGETGYQGRRVLWIRGRSPRVRGNLELVPGIEERGGSIPACAGKPTTATVSAIPTTVDPRVCGETTSWPRSRSSGAGRSPRVRGNRDLVPRRVSCCGSIPACAGKPFTQGKTVLLFQVDPRVCGETPLALGFGFSNKGRSPRVRGNRAGDVVGGRQDRSIPACAGKPATHDRSSDRSAVDPRVCGETG